MRGRRQGAWALALVIMVWAGARAVAAQDMPEEAVARRYDLRGVLLSDVPVFDQVDARPQLSSARLEALRAETYDPGLGPVAALDEDEVVELLAAAAQRADPGASTALRNGWLQVRSTSDGHAAVAQALRTLRAVAEESVMVDVHRLDDRAGLRGHGPILDARQAGELLRALRGTLEARQSVPLGRNVQLGDSGVISCLYDEDVSGAVLHAFDPTVTVVALGLELGVRIDRACDGERYVLRTWGRDGGPEGPMPLSRAGGPVPRVLETPVVPTARFCASGLVPPGGALLLDHGGGGGGAVLLHLRTASRPAAPGGSVPLGTLALPPSRQWWTWAADPEPSAGLRSSPHDPRIKTWMGEAGAVFDEFADGGFGAEGLAFFGPTALPGVGGPDAEELARVVAELRTAAPPRSITVDLRYGLVERGGLEAVLERGTLDRWAARAEGRLSGAAIAGETLVLVGGTERGYVRDLDMQVSFSGASPPDPIVSSIFEGVSLWCAPVVRPDGRIAGGLRFSLRRSPGAIRTVETQVLRGQWLDRGLPLPSTVGSHPIGLPRVQRAVVVTVMDAVPGEWTLVSARPLGGSEESLVVAVRMEAR